MSRERSRRRSLVARAALLSASVLVAVLIGEGAFRAYLAAGAVEAPRDDSEWRARYRHMNETLYKRSDVPGLVYEPRPGAAVEMEYGLASFNGAGMRDTREFDEEPGDQRRVVMIGDSLVWSEFVALEDSLPRQVEHALASPDEVVMNFGVSGYDTAQEALWYERGARRFQPDVVVVVYCLNDMMIMSGPSNRYADEQEQRRTEEQDQMFDRLAPVRRETLDQVNRRDEEMATFKLFARVRSLWRRAAFARRYVDEYTIAAEQPERFAAVEAGLGRLGRTIADDGARGLLVISPVLESWDRYHWTHIHEVVARAGRRAGFDVLDPLEAWQDTHEPSRLRVPGDNLHYNPRGNQLLGETIAAAIEEPR